MNISNPFSINNNLDSNFGNKLENGFIPDPKIFSSYSSDEFFNIFHRKYPLSDFLTLKDNQLFNINPLIENKIFEGKEMPDVIKYPRIEDVILKGNNIETENKNIIEIEYENVNFKKNYNESNDNNKLSKYVNYESLETNDYNLNNPLLIVNQNHINNNQKDIIFNDKDKKNYSYDLKKNDKSSNFKENLNKKSSLLRQKKKRNRNIFKDDSELNEGNNLLEHKKSKFMQFYINDNIINGFLLCDNRIQCEIKGCGRIFKDKYKLNDHLVTHSEQKLFVCDIAECDKKFKRKQTLNRHIKSFHEKKTIRKCNYCSLVFLSNNGNF